MGRAWPCHSPSPSSWGTICTLSPILANPGWRGRARKVLAWWLVCRHQGSLHPSNKDPAGAGGGWAEASRFLSFSWRLPWEKEGRKGHREVGVNPLDTAASSRQALEPLNRGPVNRPRAGWSPCSQGVFCRRWKEPFRPPEPGPHCSMLLGP